MNNEKLEGYKALKKFREDRYKDRNTEYFGSNGRRYNLINHGIYGAAIIGITIFGISNIIDPNVVLIEKVLLSMMTAVMDITLVGSSITTTEILKHFVCESNFKKKYPYVDTDIKNSALEKLIKYEDEKEVEKDKSMKYDEVANINKDDRFAKMSNSEKIAYLNEQKEFWESVSLREKYLNDEPKEKIK